MIRRPTPLQFVIASLKLIFTLLTFGALLVATIAFAQDSLPAPSTSGDTVMGMVLKGALALTILVGGWAGTKLSGFLSAKTTQTNQTAAQALGWSLTNKVWLKAQAVGGKLLAKERALMDSILSDGVITADEFKTFASAIAQDLRDIAAEEIPMLAGLLGGNQVANTIVEGFATKVAHQLLVTGSAAPTQSPLPSVIPPQAVPSPQ